MDMASGEVFSPLLSFRFVTPSCGLDEPLAAVPFRMTYPSEFQKQCLY